MTLAAMAMSVVSSQYGKRDGRFDGDVYRDMSKKDKYDSKGAFTYCTSMRVHVRYVNGP